MTHPLIRQIIDRDCHVSMSAKAVVRHVISKLKNGYETYRAMPKADRRKLIEDCLKVHQRNRQLFTTVMSGSTGPPKRIRAERPVPLPAKLSGKEVVRLMRKHRKSIAGLAFRLGSTQKRVREVRAGGLANALAVRDWLEAITGDDPGPIPERYRIRNHTEEAPCGFCGCPLYAGDDAYEYVGEVFCSVSCCRQSRGWK